MPPAAFSHLRLTQSLQQLCAPTHTQPHLHTSQRRTCTLQTHRRACTLHTHRHTRILQMHKSKLPGLGVGLVLRVRGGGGSCRQHRVTALPCCHSWPCYRAAGPPACSPDGRNLPGPRQEETAAGRLWGEARGQPSKAVSLVAEPGLWVSGFRSRGSPAFQHVGLSSCVTRA